MATARKRISPQEREEYERLLAKGGELLAQGKVIEAKDHLEKAYALDPRNEKGQNLLGLSYFKLGLFDRASEIYEVLVRENPADHTLRVNLGLVYLKTNALQRAIREFETATDLAPEHKKAHNYLGLALAQAGEYGRAREHFIAAGSDAMAEKMARAMAGESFVQESPRPPDQKRGFAEIEGSEVVAERGGEVRTPAGAAEQAQAAAEEAGGEDFLISEHAEAPPAAPPEDELGSSFDEPKADQPASQPEIELSEADQEPAQRQAPAEVEAPAAPAPWAASTNTAAAPQVAPRGAAQGPVAQGGPGIHRPPWRPRVPVGPPPLLAELAVNARVPAHPDAAYGAFHITEDTVVVTVEGEVLSRVSGLLAYHGTVKLAPELKRVRGRKTDKPFGEGERQMMRASGKGALVIATGYDAFLSVDLGDESAYFREEVLFAFEEALSFENGRVAIRDGLELELVHLRGKGRALVVLSGPLRSIEVRMDQPVTVPLTCLVGWQGNLSPRMSSMPLASAGLAPADAVELSGEGFVLFVAPPQ